MRDVIVIGSGAGGGAMALALSQAGYSVLVLEKGPRYTRDDYRKNEVEVLKEDFFSPPIIEDPHLLVAPTAATATLSNIGWTASCVGGGTEHMGGFMYRYHPVDFRMKSHFGEYHENEDWPFSYEDIEPYYTKAEWEIGVSGSSIVNAVGGRRSKPYPMPPLASHTFSSELTKYCEKKGLIPFCTPRAVNSIPYQGRQACELCDNCAGFGCPVGAKGSAQESLLLRAENTNNCKVSANVMVREIVLDKHGNAKSCIYIDKDGKEKEEFAKVICVSCSAIESARLLLMSKSALFPNGIGNDNGLVGRHLQFHSTTQGRARFPLEKIEDTRAVSGTKKWNPFLGVSLMDYYFSPSGVSDIDKGGVLRFDMQPNSPLQYAEVIASNNGNLLWGIELKKKLKNTFSKHRLVYFEGFHDYFANRNTYVTLDKEVKDKWGLPVARVHLDTLDHHSKIGKWLMAKGQDILVGLGAEETFEEEVGGISSYLVHGTCRSGVHPDSSVLNSFCQVHGVRNLFVVDGSFMPTSGGGSPTLTIVANSFRVADHIICQEKYGAFD